jgi:hypothetical protein
MRATYPPPPAGRSARELVVIRPGQRVFAEAVEASLTHDELVSTITAGTTVLVQHLVGLPPNVGQVGRARD